jgi:tetratricopeptide (TPR) repeat protein
VTPGATAQAGLTNAASSKTVLVLILGVVVFAPQRDKEQAIVSMWIDAVRAHEAGTIDPPLREIANQPPRTFDLVCRTLNSALAANKNVQERNDIRRRGALLHTDIAMLLPARAADFTQKDLTLGAPVDLHWQRIQPHADKDPFVAAWSRAVAAHFESRYLYGSAELHLNRTFIVLPADPVLLFYADTLYEAYASARVQSVPSTRPASVRELNMPPAAEEWRRAEKYFRDSLKLGGPMEGRLRLARVKGQLGDHAEAAAILRDVVPHLTDPRLQYLGHLFLGTEEGALGRIAESRQSFEQAARMQPTAQSPLLGVGEMYRRTGNLTAAQETLQRLAALPDDPRLRQDPYLDYFRSFAFDAEAQLAAVRASITDTGR